ncbi:MAG: carboxypeptidase regulatory-like domain-containing protein, partial [Thiohalorhabdaceae bacterium]
MMPLMRRFLLPLLLLTAATAGAQERPAPADVSLFVFEGDLPSAGVGVEVDGQPQARTNGNGAAWLLVPAGERTLTLFRPDGRKTDIHLDIAPGENMRVIATLPQGATGGEPFVDIQSSKGSDALRTMQADAMEGPTGTLRGRVVSAEDGGPVAGARVFVSGTPVDVKTDDQGRFSAELPEGTYAVSV